MSTFTKPAVLDGAKAVGLSLTLGAVLAFFPLLFIAAAPLLPIPVAFITSRHGPALGLLASLLTGALALALTGFAPGLLVFTIVGLAGIGAGVCLRRGISQFRLFVSLAAIFCVAMLIWISSLLAMAGLGPVNAMQQISDEAVGPARELYISLGMSQEDADDIISQARDFAMSLPYVAPAILLVLSVTLSGASVAVARRVFERLRQPFPRDFTFRKLRLHFGFAYLMILGLVCELAAPYLPEAYGSPADMVGANLIIVTEAVFFIQGIAIASYFLWHYKASKGKKAIVYASLILLEITLSLTSWMGLFDTWIDYRRRFIKRDGQTA